MLFSDHRMEYGKCYDLRWIRYVFVPNDLQLVQKSRGFYEARLKGVCVARYACSGNPSIACTLTLHLRQFLIL